jgi:N-acetylmuramoyl-L-alanine amidase
MTYTGLFRAWATVMAAILAAILLTMPATIAETVFITNNGEGQLLADGTGARQQQIAQVLRVGIENDLTTH